MRRLRFRLDTLRQQAWMAASVARHLLEPSLADWYRERTAVARAVRRLLEGDLAAVQRPNADVAFTSTPVDGIGACFTANGRLSVMLGSSANTTHQIPYYVDESDGPLRGADPMAGSFAGFGADGEPEWFWAAPTSVGYRAGLPVVDVVHEASLPVRQTAYVVPQSETVVRDYAVSNPTTEPLEVEFVSHTRANANANRQLFTVWESSPNALSVGADLRWASRTQDVQLRVGLDRDTDAVARRPGGSFDDAEVTGTVLEGRLATRLRIPPGETEWVSVFVSAGRSTPDWSDLRAQTATDRQRAVLDWWDRWLADAPAPSPGRPDATPPRGADGGVARGVDPDEGASTTADPDGPGRDAAPVDPDAVTEARLRRQYRLSLALTGALADPATGSVSASPNLQPPYYPCWPRDAAFAAVALARAGRSDPARRLLADFLPAVVESDGSFRQCYDRSGGFAGAVRVEADQQPLYAWAVARTADHVDDEAFLAAAWPAVRASLDYTVDSVRPDGLLAPTPDIDEWPDRVRQSLWTNAWAYRGLTDGARLADRLGADGARYADAAERVGRSLARELFDGDAYATYRDAAGDHADLHAYDAVALHPTGWADAFGTAAPLERDLRELARAEPTWVPGACMLATALYERGADKPAERLLRRVSSQTTVAGHLVEEADGEFGHRFASPLGWSHAAFALAMQRRP